MSVDTAQRLTIRSYARALFNAGRTQGVIQRLVEESKMLTSLLEKHPTLGPFIESPQVPLDAKRALVDKAFKDKINPILLNLLYMMIDRERGILLGEILDAFQELAEQAEGIFAATVASARELGFQEKLKLKTALEKFTACHLRIRHIVRPALIGGFVFRFKDTLIDASVKHALDDLRRQFSKREGIAA